MISMVEVDEFECDAVAAFATPPGEVSVPYSWEWVVGKAVSVEQE